MELVTLGLLSLVFFYSCVMLLMRLRVVTKERNEARRTAESLLNRLRETKFQPQTFTLKPRRKIKSIDANGVITWTDSQ